MDKLVGAARKAFS